MHIIKDDLVWIINESNHSIMDLLISLNLYIESFPHILQIINDRMSNK